MNKKTVLTIIKLIPIVAAVLTFRLVFTNAQAGWFTTVSVILAFLGFVFFFIGRKSAKEDKTLKILGILDILSTVSIIVLYAVVFIAIAKSITDTDDVDYDRGDYVVENMEIGTNLGTFHSIDLDGNEVTEAIFADKDVTVVNVWATFCGPCIAEMPELENMAEELPDNAQIIGIVIDASPEGAAEKGEWESNAENVDLAKDICRENGVKYTNILASDSVAQAFKDVEAVPTTFVVDKSGNTVCKAFVGAYVNEYKRAVSEYLEGL